MSAGAFHASAERAVVASVQAPWEASEPRVHEGSSDRIQGGFNDCV